MKRRRRTRILIEGSPDLPMHLSAEAEAEHKVRIIDEPSGGLVMMRMKDTARKDAFFLGEVMVTEAKVRIGNSLGIGLVRGDAPVLARSLAVIDAAWNAGSPLINHWISLLEAEEASLEESRRKEAASILKTRVDFSTMETFS
ncbi:MAG: phosphonate C-P lyase system protein PhnG [Spirochaetaceae bacterium]|nr:phosphonate C-P lyase system protein PhnG [Spirochaetaceae bacterium]